MNCGTNHKNCIASKMMQVYNFVLANPEEHVKILELLDSHIEAMIYNIASIASVTALLDEKVKIELKHIGFIKEYIVKQCIKSSKKNNTSTQSGGSFPAEYFGYNSGAYTESNYGGTNVSDINFADGIAREAIPISGGAKNKNHSGGSFPAEYFGNNSGAYTEANYGGPNVSDINFTDSIARSAIHITGGGTKLKSIVENNKEVAKYIKKVIAFNDVTISKSALGELLKIVNIHLNCIGDDISKYNKIKPAILDKIFSYRKHAVFK